MQTPAERSQLTPEESCALQAWTVSLLARLEPFAQALDRQLDHLAEVGHGNVGLGHTRRQQLIARLTDQYRELLTLTPKAPQRMRDLGRRYHRWGFSPSWVCATSGLFAVEFEDVCAGAPPAQGRILAQALSKRLRLLDAWQLDGFHAAAEALRRALEHHPLRNPLTGLLTRVALDELLPIALLRARRHGTKVMVALVGLDDFPELVGVHGSDAADRVQQQFAERLTCALRRIDLVVHWEAGASMLILEDIYRVDIVATVIARLRQELDLPYALADDQLHQFPFSAGITLFPDDNVDALALLQHAQRALRRARADKQPLGRSWLFHDERLAEAACIGSEEQVS